MITRRDLIATAGLVLSTRSAANESAAAEFGFKGVYLDAAFVHPMSRQARDRGAAYFDTRFTQPHAVSPYGNPRNAAVEQFARLINCASQDVAVVPSTLVAENLVNAALQIGPGAGVVTDALHYDASLVLYAERGRQGTPIKIIPLRDDRIDLSDIRDALTPQIKLIAISQVSSATGFEHDLAEVCAVAHKAGALVYADIIQAAGAIAVDVAASGVDFAACGTYKWLMGDFGAAFLYVRRDRLERLRRTEIGWRQIRNLTQHLSPFDPAGPALGAYEFRQDAVGLFEVGTPAWGALAIAQASIGAINETGIEKIAGHRQPLMDQLRDALSSRPGFVAMTPPQSRAPILAFAVKDAQSRFEDRLRANNIQLSVYPNNLRISPSIYNTPDDIRQLVQVLST